MRLRAKDGAQVELRPMGYEFAATENHAVRDWDANWLVVDGRVRLSDGRQWSFQDPCLTTWEARELSAWLTAVAAGQMAAVPFYGGTEQDEERLMTFTELNLAFSVAACGDGEVTVRVHLSFESGPPWLPHGESGQAFAFFVEVTCSPAEVGLASEEWARQLATFPVRH